MTLTFLLLAVVMADPSATPFTGKRQWTDTNGRVIQAQFLYQSGDELTLIKEGKRFRLPKKKLSALDKSWLNSGAQLDPAKAIVRKPVRVPGHLVQVPSKLASAAHGEIVDVWFNRLPSEDGFDALRMWVQVRHPKRKVLSDADGRFPDPGYIELAVLLRHNQKLTIGVAKRIGDVHTLQWRSPTATHCHIIREFRFGEIPKGTRIEAFQVEFWDYKKKLYSRMEAPQGWKLGEIKALQKNHNIKKIEGNTISGRGYYGSLPLSTVEVKASEEFPEGVTFMWNPPKSKIAPNPARSIVNRVP